MSDLPPAADSAAQAAAAAASSPARRSAQLNANAKQFVPKLEGPSPTTAPRSHASPPAIPSTLAGGAAATSSAGVTALPRAHQGPPPPPPPPPPALPSPLAPGMFLPGMFGGVPMSPLFPMGLVPPTPLTAAAAIAASAPATSQVPPVIPPPAAAVAATPSTPSGKGAGAPAASAAVPPPLGVMPSPLGMPMFMPNPLFFAAPPTPTAPLHVSVGNASLVALRSTNPPKFSCVLLVGLPKVGKTTVGRRVVQDLKEDRLGWAFFSGGDHIKDSATQRPVPWQTTREVFDALSAKLDDAISRQSVDPIRGLVIDKQCRGTEELYYLTALLRSKGLTLNGVVGLETDDDDKLMTRLGMADDEGFREKLKYHRVVLTRIKETAKAVGLWHAVDALHSEVEVAHKLRSMILGCSAQPPAKQLVASAYHESLTVMVDNYITFTNTMTTLTNLVKTAKPGQYPGFSNYLPVTQSMLTAQEARRPPQGQPNLREHCVRRKSDGTKYVLVFDGANLYLVPRHMRCVFTMANEAWLGVPLVNAGRFVLEGELVRLTKERNKEKFLVTDVLYWQDKQAAAAAAGGAPGSPSAAASNAVARLTWRERQDKLKTHLCNEISAFFPKGDIVVVHQLFEEFKTSAKLLETFEYPTEGLIFVAPNSSKRDEAQYLWRPIESVTVDFRLGKVKERTEGAVVFSLEVFDQKGSTAKYGTFRSDTVTVSLPRPFAIEGAVAICGLDPSYSPSTPGSTPMWIFHRTRSDVTTAALRERVEELLTDGLVPKAAMAGFLTHAVAAEAGADTGIAAAVGLPVAAVVATGAQQPGVPGSSTRTAFGSALPAVSTGGVSPAPKAPAAAPPLGSGTHVEQLRAVVQGSVRQHSATALPQGSAAQQILALGVASVTVVPAAEGLGAAPPAASVAGTSAAGGTEDEGRRAARRERERCANCSHAGKGRVDDRDSKFYCYRCWAKLGTEYCTDCKAFTKGRRQGADGDFFCEACWDAYNAKHRAKERAAAAATSGKESRKAAQPAGGRGKRGGGGSAEKEAAAPPSKTITAEEGAPEKSAEAPAAAAPPAHVNEETAAAAPAEAAPVPPVVAA